MRAEILFGISPREKGGKKMSGLVRFHSTKERGRKGGPIGLPTRGRKAKNGKKKKDGQAASRSKERHANNMSWQASYSANHRGIVKRGKRYCRARKGPIIPVGVRNGHQHLGQK